LIYYGKEFTGLYIFRLTYNVEGNMFPNTKAERDENAWGNWMYSITLS